MDDTILLIEKLKDPKRAQPFGILSPEEQKCLKKAGKANLISYSRTGWHNTTGEELFKTDTYAIKPDYHPKPEYVNLEIEEFADGENTKWLGVWNTPEAFFLPHQFTHLHCLPSLPNFDGFYKSRAGLVEVDFQWVSRQMPGVVARFRK